MKISNLTYLELAAETNDLEGGAQLGFLGQLDGYRSTLNRIGYTRTAIAGPGGSGSSVTLMTQNDNFAALSAALGAIGQFP